MHGCGRDDENKKSSAFDRTCAASIAWTATSGGGRHARRIAGQSCVGGRSSNATVPDDEPGLDGATGGTADDGGTGEDGRTTTGSTRCGARST
ncbi:hypothetical protein BURMUCF2_1899, partial [Burkholderia multivorans CF2]